MTIKILALAASARADSLNKRLLSLAVTQAQKAGADVTVLDYKECESPLYQGEYTATLPNGAKRLSEALQVHDGLLLASPEYNWSIPAALKNLIDWLSIDPAAPFKHKHALLMCASPSVRGGILGLNQLSLPLNHLGMWVYPHLIAIGDAQTQLGQTQLNEKDQEFLNSCVADFVRTITALAR